MNRDLSQLDNRSREFKLLKNLRQNIHSFAAHKTADLSERISFALQNNDTKAAFIEQASRLASLHHTDWLETEYRLALANTQAAKQWLDINDRKDALPFLKYVTVGDALVRPAHKKLDATILPVEHPFWSEFFPPNGFNCRCIVMQVAGGQTDVPPFPDKKEIPPSFRFNPGAAQQLFNPKHPYFKRAKIPDSWSLVAAARLDVFDLVYQSPTAAQVLQHPVTLPMETHGNLKTAKKLADAGEQVKLLPFHYVFDQTNIGVKSPDALVNEEIADFKNALGTHTSIQNAIRRTKRQGAALAIINLEAFDEIQIIRALKAVKGKYLSIQKIWLLNKGRIIKITRNQIENDSFRL